MVLPFFSALLTWLEGFTVSVSGTPPTPVAETLPETVVVGRHLPLILVWPFLHFLLLLFLAAIACLRAIVPVGTVTVRVASPDWTGTKTIVIVPSELAWM